MAYVSIDGDDIGRLLTQRIYAPDGDQTVEEFSDAVAGVFLSLATWVKAQGGRVLFCAGDSIAFKLDGVDTTAILDQLRESPFTVTVGVGDTLREAHWALNVAKSMGKNQVLHFEQVAADLFGRENRLKKDV